MKKSVLLSLIFSVFLAGCSQREVVPSNTTLFLNNNVWWDARVRSEQAIDRMVLPVKAQFKDHEFGVFIDLARKIYPSWSKKEYLKKQLKDSMSLYFYSFPPFNELAGYKYQFNTAKAYLITSSQTYHLKAVDDRTGKPIDYSINDLGDYLEGYKPEYGEPVYKFYRYYVPVTCEQLNGASFEISGIYQNDVELPPIQFRVFLQDEGMKLCMQGERE